MKNKSAIPAVIPATNKKVTDRQTAAIEALPESKRWDPVPGSEGHQTPEAPAEDEDDEDRNESAQLVEEGVNAAESDQAAQTVRAGKNNIRRLR